MSRTLDEDNKDCNSQHIWDLSTLLGYPNILVAKIYSRNEATFRGRHPEKISENLEAKCKLVILSK